MHIGHHRHQRIRFATFVSLFVNGLLGIGQVAIGITFGIHALFADGIHSCSDLAIDFLIMLASYYGNQEADSCHPYGHGRIETAVTIVLAAIISLIGATMLTSGIQHIWHPDALPYAHHYAIWITSLSILANEMLYHYMRFVAKQVNSDLLFASALHNRSDAASSLIVVIALLGIRFGFVYADGIATTFVSIIIINMGIKLGWSSICELIDTGTKPKTLAYIKQIIHETPGVLALHQLRTRLMGKRILVDVHIMVDSHISVSEGHHIASQVHLAIVKKVENVMDVTTHIDSEDDEKFTSTKNLPSRNELWPKLDERWKDLPGFQQLLTYKLHYLHNTIEVELWFPNNTPRMTQLDAVTKQYRDACHDLPFIQQVRLLLTNHQ